MKTEVQEKLVEIANRVKGKGDTWEVTGVETPQNSLTDALEAWFEIATIKPKAFRLDLVQGKLYLHLHDAFYAKRPN